MKLLSIVLACLCMQTAAAQNFPNIYRDVLALRKTMSAGVFNTDDASQEIYLPILLKYFAPGESHTLNETKLLIQKSNNPFGINDFLRDMKLNQLPTSDWLTEKNKKMMKGEYALSAASSSAEAVAAVSAPGLNAPVIASAITSLVIKRAKQELTVTFFNKFRDELKNQTGLNILFPKTTDLISNIETYLYASYLNTLRAAFAEDIAALVTTVPAYLRSENVSALILKDTSRYNLWLSIPILDGVSALVSGGSLADAIQKFRPDKIALQKGEWKNVYNTLELLCQLSEAVRDESGISNWISTEDFSKKIIADPINTKLFYGLLYEKIRSLSFTKKDGSELKLTEVITNAQEKIDAVNNTIKVLLQGYNQAAAALGTLQTIGKPVDGPSFQTTIAVINKISNTTKNSCTQINRLIGITYKDYPAKTDILFNNVSTLTALLGNLYEKQYAAAVMNSAILINRYLPKDTTTQHLLKYGSLAASIVESKNAEDISAALDAAILPTGSSSIKQHTSWSVSINSYIGANWYTEKYKSTTLTNKAISFPTFGISLPVGVAFSKGLRNKWVGSLSLFASVLDLGAVASYQLSTPDSVTSKQLPDFTWKNLLAPGGFIVLGRLFNTPLSLGIGAQKGPALRSISYKAGGTTVDLSDQLSWRTGVFLAVDIPFFNLYSRPYAKSTR
ncbi:MAG TPA: hypothetical protein VGE25_04765 [Sediminibacterium sp.]